MIVLLGGSGFIGSAFARYFQRMEIPYRCLSRAQTNYYEPDQLRLALKQQKSKFLINAAGYTGKPNVDACEHNRAECLRGNAVLPGIVRSVCQELNLPWGHVSSGCIYTGSRPDGNGFTETDTPNFDFRHNNCSFYSGTKSLGEECLAGADGVYLWRLRIPFNHEDSDRNYLSKLQRYERLLDVRNSISHLDEFIHACCECWNRRVPYGIYNMTNTGSITTREVVLLLKRAFNLRKKFSFFDNESHFMRHAMAPRSSCVLDNSKLIATGIPITEVHEAVERALANWKTL